MRSIIILVFFGEKQWLCKYMESKDGDGVGAVGRGQLFVVAALLSSLHGAYDVYVTRYRLSKADDF